MEELISVIVPIYNCIEWLPRCVESIRNQTYRNLEILLVDDGSQDGSDQMAEKFALIDQRIRVFHKKNGGSSSARNLGIEMAGGSYLGFIDSDDYIDEHMYERLMKLVQEENLLMVQTSRDEIDENGERRPDVCVPPTEIVQWDCDLFMRELLMHRGDCSFCTKLTSAALFKEDKFPEGVLNEDFHLLIRLLPKVKRVAILPNQDYHVFYRIGSNTRVKSKDEFSRVYSDIVDNADLVELIVEKEYPQLKKEAVRFALFQRLDYLLHIPVSQMNYENAFYRRVKKYLRGHFGKMLVSPYLTGKNKVYLFLLTLAPKLTRQVHKTIKRMD